MILHPDGRVEGTPEEIEKWSEIQAKKQKREWIKFDSMSYGTCSNAGKQCYCTGACMNNILIKQGEMPNEKHSII